ncbi:MAG: hypothetical protein J5772_05465 [Clostridia bacterium]|nr:hypothetical protein [Clostridia bacterium]
MFGYITPFIPELKVRDKELYQAYYCGLCRALGKYGLGSKLTLTYDATFASVLLAAAVGKEPEFSLRGCPAHPVRGRIPTVTPDDIADYCAAVCVLLAKYKLLDDARDGKPMRKAAIPVLNRGIRRAEKKYPEAALALSDGLDKLGEIESRGECDPDDAPMLFGRLLGSLISAYPDLPDEAKPLLTELGRKLGGYIYIIDAWDDRAEDEKRGSYNIFLRGGFADPEAACKAMLDMYINSAVLAYDLLDVKTGKELLDNIMYMGLAARAAEVLEGKNAPKGSRCEDEAGKEEAE